VAAWEVRRIPPTARLTPSARRYVAERESPGKYRAVRTGMAGHALIFADQPIDNSLGRLPL
jgi:hypothetical protein